MRRCLQDGTDNLPAISAPETSCGTIYTPTHNPSHSKPHGSTAAEPLTSEEAHDAARQGAEVVDGNDDAHETAARVAKGLLPILIANDATEDALIVTEEDEGHGASQGDGPTQAAPAAEPRVLETHRVAEDCVWYYARRNKVVARSCQD